MQPSDCTRPMVSALALGAALCLTPALALGKSSQPLGAVLSSVPTSATEYTVDVSGTFSFDGLEDLSPGNEVKTLNIGPNNRVVGIGWDVTLFAEDPSWLLEMAVAFGSSSAVQVVLAPGDGDDFSDTRSYSSGGVINIPDFQVGADGVLRMEFFETFDDFSDDWDGIWQSGTLTIAVVPEPATYGLMALGLLAVGAAARRRRG